MSALSRALGLLLASPAFAAPPPNPLDLQQFQLEVLEAHPSVEAARQAIAAAQGRELQARDWPDPVVRGELAPLSAWGDEHGHAVMVEAELPRPAMRRAERGMSALEVEAARLDAAGTQSALAEQAAQAWLDRWLAERALAEAQARLDLMRAWQRAADAALAAGRGMAADPAMAEDEALDAAMEVEMWQGELRASGELMNLLLGQDPQAPLPPLAALALPAAPVGQVLEAPQVKADLARAEAMDVTVDAVWAERGPMLTVGTGWDTMAMSPDHRFTVSAMVSVPVGTGTRGAMDEARAEAARMHAEADAMSRERAAMVAELRVEIDTATRRLTRLESEMIPVRERRLELTRSAFASGMGPLSDVLDAERRLHAARLEAAAARAQVWRSTAALQAQLGESPSSQSTEVSP